MHVFFLVSVFPTDVVYSVAINWYFSIHLRIETEHLQEGRQFHMLQRVGIIQTMLELVLCNRDQAGRVIK